MIEECKYRISIRPKLPIGHPGRQCVETHCTGYGNDRRIMEPEGEPMKMSPISECYYCIHYSTKSLACECCKQSVGNIVICNLSGIEVKCDGIPHDCKLEKCGEEMVYAPINSCSFCLYSKDLDTIYSPVCIHPQTCGQEIERENKDFPDWCPLEEANP